MPQPRPARPLVAPAPIHISSPQRRNNPYMRAGTDSPQTPRVQRFGDAQNAYPPPSRGFDEYELSPSPTHDYLDVFDSYEPADPAGHSAIHPSPSMEFEYEKPGAADYGRGGAAFAPARFDSSNHLAPMAATTARGGRGAGAGAGARGGGRTCVPSDPRRRRLIFFGVPAALVIVAVIVIGVVVAVSHHSSSASSSTSSAGNSTGSSAETYNTTSVAIQKGSGTNGSTVETDLGVTFTYVNNFGGSWAQDPYNPYSVSGQAQSWSPSLLDTWVWGEHIVRGVNLGGWLVTEPFIVPALYEEYYNTSKPIDEYTLSQAMGENLTARMTEHYATFITERDFADIAAAGLNYVRIPLGYWAIDTQGTEPFLKGVSWTYFLKAIDWCRKYGLRIYLDFHALPGSQNGWNHSGKEGSVNWMYGVMGIANAQRHLEYIRSLVEYISQDGVREVVTMLGLVNEVESSVVGEDVLARFYYQAYELIRSITGYGAANGPIILIHEGFLGIGAWAGFLSGADRLGLDQHPYLAFGTQNNNPWLNQSTAICAYGGGTNSSQADFGIIIGGEWSNAINDCGYWLDGVDSTPAYESTGTGSCTGWDEWFNWSDTTKQSVHDYALANFDALQNTFFWTWKIGNSTTLGYPSSPFWHYKLGLEQGWIPTDPRVAGGYCNGIGVGGDYFNGTFPASATGALTTASIAADQLASYSAWPPTSLGPSFTAAQISLFPTLTRTGAPITLATPTHSANATIGAGWAYAADSVGAWTTVAGCLYPDEYNATAASALPSGLCTGTVARRAVLVEPTAAPPQR
ncbi:hypothetical protein Q5752_004648 [Cryptotrichosporon argae]